MKIRLSSTEDLRNLPPAETLCGTHFIARGLNVIFGPSGSYKSFYTLDCALTIAQSYPVIYIAAEGSAGLFKRIQAWHSYTKHPDSGNLYFITQEVNLRDFTTISALIQLIQPLKPALIIFDTLARCLVGGDENSAKDTGLAINHCALIQRTLNTAVTLVHHSNRAERGERGSGAIRGAADAMLEMSLTGDGIVKLTCSKVKDEEPWSTELYVFQPIDTSGVLLTTTDINPKTLSPNALRILDFLALAIFDESGAKGLQVVNALNISERQLYRLLSHLKVEGAIRHDSKGDPYKITDRGRDILSRFNGRIGQKITVANIAPYKPTDITDIQLSSE